MSEAQKTSLLRKLTLKSPKKSQASPGKGSSTSAAAAAPPPPVRLPLSSLRGTTPPLLVPATSTSPPSTIPVEVSDAPKVEGQPKSQTIQVGSQDVPLSSVVLAFSILLVFYVLWRAFIASSATIIHLLVMAIVFSAGILLSPLKNHLCATPNSSGTIHTPPQSVDDILFQQSQRQHERQAFLR